MRLFKIRQLICAVLATFVLDVSCCAMDRLVARRFPQSSLAPAPEEDDSIRYRVKIGRSGRAPAAYDPADTPPSALIQIYELAEKNAEFERAFKTVGLAFLNHLDGIKNHKDLEFLNQATRWTIKFASQCDLFQGYSDDALTQQAERRWHMLRYIPNMPEITRITIIGSCMTEQDCRVFGEALSTLPALTTVELVNCYLPPSGIALPAWITDFRFTVDTVVKGHEEDWSGVALPGVETCYPAGHFQQAVRSTLRTLPALRVLKLSRGMLGNKGCIEVKEPFSLSVLAALPRPDLLKIVDMASSHFGLVSKDSLWPDPVELTEIFERCLNLELAVLPPLLVARRPSDAMVRGAKRYGAVLSSRFREWFLFGIRDDDLGLRHRDKPIFWDISQRLWCQDRVYEPGKPW